MAAKYVDNEMKRNLRYSDIQNEPKKMLLPVAGYQNMPLISLELAVKPLEHLMPQIQQHVWIAKQNCQEPTADGLTEDESASIQLYTMEWEPSSQCLYYLLNQTLRSEDRQQLKPWFSYLKLLLTALYKLPSVKCVVWRGIKTDLSDEYLKVKPFVWWGMSSCTDSLEIMESEQFLGKTGTRTLFNIECENGKIIKPHSYYKAENEILLLPATQFKVLGKTNAGNGLHIVHVREILPPYVLLQTPFVNDGLTSSTVTALTASSTVLKQRLVKCVIVGDGAVGKTVLLQTYLTNLYPDLLVPTVFEQHTIDIIIDGESVGLHLVDTWLPEVQYFCSRVPIILIGTKIDLRDNRPLGEENLCKDRSAPITQLEGEALRKQIGAVKYYECSAKTKTGLSIIFEGAILNPKVPQVIDYLNGFGFQQRKHA
ncbi:unnamed protein product [Didymodactylos carnosus]|uniref:NAD(P)(+)--arginine ADP-ribosyltransferase n=1 Tax=Didymodactylos carnosus TaxID=1234261 RepID=A0A815LKK1_9BILA|nr:unnamed protein product [Didymodactylos carnosus]CAF1408559.1 unnamed protein product [Didymodactylos carnosus]CAF4049536.1 unnamed protein product [Didymodactylos carnosus]CAF4298514.1 unnamed protein product [Didymodactylos carnosus]